MSFISIDPGIETGYAIWSQQGELRTFGVISHGPRMEWLARTELTCGSLDQILAANPELAEMVCEWPQYFESEGGRGSAASGDLIKLVFMVGRTAQLAAYRGIRFLPVGVNSWKGQMSKEAVKARIKKRLGEAATVGIYKHAWDAVGIGLDHLGQF